MDHPVKLFKTSNGQAKYYTTYDATLQLWPVPYESRFVTTPYGETHIISCGLENAFPLVLLHAGQASSTMWFPNVAPLSLNFHVFALDTLGEPGKSIPARRNDSKGDCAAWLEGVLDDLGISQTHLMGLSRGAWMAMNLALLAPDRLERIVLLSPAAALVGFNSFFSSVMQAVMHLPTRGVSKMALNSLVAPGFAINPGFADQFMTGLENWNWAVNTSGYSGIMPCTFSDEELHQICHQTLLLIGDQDRINPPRALERARQMMPHLEGEIIPQGGHLLNMEQPDKVNSKVLNFLVKG